MSKILIKSEITIFGSILTTFESSSILKAATIEPLALGSRSEGRGIDPRPMLDGSGVKAMPGSIPTHPILVHYRKNKKIQVAKWGTPPKNIYKKILDSIRLFCDYFKPSMT